jgi:hypothetical protein
MADKELDDDLDLTDALKQLNVDDKKIVSFLSNANGIDYINLINAVKSKRSEDKRLVKNILAKYDISIREDRNNMNFDRLQALYQGVQTTGKIVDVMEWLQPITENNPMDHMLTLEGYTHTVQVKSSVSEKLIDWLDKHKIEYLVDDQGKFHIKCKNRDQAYDVDRAVNTFTATGDKNFVRDSQKTGIDNMSIKEDAKKREKVAKEKLEKLKPRNPHALDASRMNAKNGRPIDSKRKEMQKDPVKGKHKKPITDESVEYFIGESVMVGKVQGTVKIPNGPNNTVGIFMEGKLSMVDNMDVSRIDENVLGMTAMNPLFRLRELAGLPPAPATDHTSDIDTDEFSDVNIDDEYGSDIPDDNEEDFDSLDTSDGDIGSDFDDDLTPNAFTASSPNSVASNIIGSKSPITPKPPITTAIPPAITPTVPPSISKPIPSMGGVPGDLPPVNPEISSTSVPTVSEAMGDIEDHLNNIQTKLSDIRLSEYKTLVRKLQDLTNQIQAMGKDYLGEQRRMKENARLLNSVKR